MSQLRLPAEIAFAEELTALKKEDQGKKPANWELSPAAVVDYLVGCTLKGGKIITPKYIGNRRLMEIAVATLTTDRALLLYGLPGTAKSWVSEHLTAAITGDSQLLIQGTAGTSEEAIRYGWNYALLLAKGPSRAALVETPMLRGMQTGKIVRLEELTRMGSDVQDTLITVLSEKVLPVPELNLQISAQRGFNVIATANNRDKGVNELSSALKRRFNTVILPVPATLDEEVEIVEKRVADFAKSAEFPFDVATEPNLAKEIKRVVAMFRELRQGVSLDGKTKVKSPSGTLSTAEAISVLNSGLALTLHFGDGQLHADDIASGILGAIVKDPTQDAIVFKEYLDTVVKDRAEWKDLYRACRDLL